MTLGPKEGPKENFGPSGEEIFEAAKHLLAGRQDLTIYYQERFEIAIFYQKKGSLIIEVQDSLGASLNPAQTNRQGTWMYIFENGTTVPKFALFTEKDSEELEECALHQAPLSLADIYESLYTSRAGHSMSEILALANPPHSGYADLNARYDEISASARRFHSLIHKRELPETSQNIVPSYCWREACQMLGLPVIDLSVEEVLAKGAHAQLTKTEPHPYLAVLSALVQTTLDPVTQLVTKSSAYILVDITLRPGLSPELKRRYNLDEIQTFSLLPAAFARP